jgi:hypothetical protein
MACTAHAQNNDGVAIFCGQCGQPYCYPAVRNPMLAELLREELRKVSGPVAVGNLHLLRAEGYRVSGPADPLYAEFFPDLTSLEAHAHRLTAATVEWYRPAVECLFM